MELKVIDASNTETGKVTLPIQFEEEVRVDLIKRAVEVLQSKARQAYGANSRAGKRASARISKRRHDYRGCYGHGISRIPRKIMSRRGTRMNWVGAIVPGTVGGRRAHAPKPDKKWVKKINRKERRKAIRSAIAATIVKELSLKRGHKVPTTYPFVLNTRVEDISKTSELNLALEKLGFSEEMSRVSVKKVRAGKGTLRGRKYRTKKGPLFVVSKDCALIKAASNVLGVQVALVNELNAELLAPGADVGRVTLFTQAALDRLGKEKLFTLEPVKVKISESKQT